MKTELCPTGGLDNILRFDKSVDGGGDTSVHIPDQYDDVKMQDQVNEEQGTVQDQVAEEGAVHDQVPVDEGGGKIEAAHDETQLNLEADVADKTDAGETSSAGKVGGIGSDPPEYQVSDVKHEEHVQVEIPGRLTIHAQSQVGDGHPDNGEGDKGVGGDGSTMFLDEGEIPKSRKSIKSGLSKLKQLATKRMTPLLEKFNMKVMSHTGGLHNILRYATKNPTGGDVIVPSSDGGGTDSVEPEEGGDVVDKGDDHVHTHIDEGEGALQVTENRAVTKYDGGGGVHDCVFDEHDHVDDEAGFNNETGPAAYSRSMMRKLVKTSPSVKKTQVQEVPPVRHGDVQERGSLPNHHDDADQD